MIYQYKIKKRLSDADIFAVWRLASGNWQLATGNWQLVTGNWQLVTGRSIDGESDKVRKIGEGKQVKIGEGKQVKVGEGKHIFLMWA